VNTSITRATILSKLNWRYATKAYDINKQISDEDVYVLEESLRLAPSSYGLQPWRFIVVKSPALREQLAETSPLNSIKILSCSYLVILARLKNVTIDYIDHYIENVAKIRQIPVSEIQQYRERIISNVVLTSPQEQFHWTARQTYIPLGMFMSAAAFLGIDTCAMEGIDPNKVDSILGLSDSDYSTIVGLTAGYRSVDDVNQSVKKVRFDHQDVFTYL
jgi:nitroreductase